MLGEITGDGKVVVVDSADGSYVVDLELTDVLSGVPRKRFVSERMKPNLPPFVLPTDYWVAELVKMVFKRIEVGSKGYLVHKVDRSVTGLVVQQPCCGPMQIPVADAGVTADGYFGLTGAVEAIGEQPIKGLINPAAGARMAVAEMLMNMAGVRIKSLRAISGRANWIWAGKLPGEAANMVDAATAMRDMMIALGIRVNGGKDSMSPTTKEDGTLIISPGELVIKCCAAVPDITKVVTPDFKGDGIIGYIDLGCGKYRLGGSSFAQAVNQLGNEVPDIDDVDLVKRAFEVLQELVGRELITACHDRSDGGLITTIAEMCMAGNCGAELILPSDVDCLRALFSEEAGVLFEVPRKQWYVVTDMLRARGIKAVQVGQTDMNRTKLRVAHRGVDVFEEKIVTLRAWWEATSIAIEMLQRTPAVVREEEASFKSTQSIPYHCSFVPSNSVHSGKKPRVAILREEGSNGDREMTAAFMSVGCEPVDVAMNDIRSGKVSDLDSFQGLVPVGGFADADTFGSAKGWAGPILFNNKVRAMFDRFYERKDTFSLGVCNGCQLMANIGWLPIRPLPVASQPRFVKNTSGRFESRWVGVQVLPSPSILLRGMEGSILGVNVAHGEGKLLLPDSYLENEIRALELAPLAYVDANGNPTEAYPYNPNGSPHGWTALCSPDGRHLAMMPHPERSFLKWQWPYLPEQFRQLEASPWLQLFQNAYTWCVEHA